MANDYILWSDDDAWWSLGTLERMIGIMDQRMEIDILAGVFGGRDHFSPAFAWQRFNDNSSMVDPGRNCGLAEIVPIANTGLHFVVMRRAALERVGEAPFSLPTPEWPQEDLAFFYHVLLVGLRSFVDAASFIAHIGDHGDAYVVGSPKGRIVNGDLVLPTQFEIPNGPRNLEPVRSYGLPSYGI